MPPDTSDPAPLEADGWHTMRRFLPYLWPRENPSLRRRIVAAMAFVLAAKAVTLALPFAYKYAVDAMATPASESAMVALALVLAYALGRFTGVAFTIYATSPSSVSDRWRHSTSRATCSKGCTACR